MTKYALTSKACLEVGTKKVLLLGFFRHRSDFVTKRSYVQKTRLVWRNLPERRLKLQKIGQIKQADIRVDDLTVFLGPLATGKTKMLHLF